MAANFLGFFGKKKEETPAQQAPPSPASPSVSAIPASPPPPSSFAPGRKKVTQRLSLKGLQTTQKSPADHSKIQLPGAMAAPAPVAQPVQIEGTVDVPFSVILGAIPEQLLTAEHSTLLAAPEAKVEIGLPLTNVLGMLPSGKLEFSLSELAQLIPSGFIQPLENITDYLNTSIVLPLGQVVSRIPAHMLTLRSDQRPIDSSVLSMQDPFSKEALEKAQAEAAAKAAEAAALQAAEESVAAAEVPPSGFQPEEEAVPVLPAEPAVPEFDESLLAAAEAALEAEKAAAAGVELPTLDDAPQSAPSFGTDQFAAPTEPAVPEESAVEGDWSTTAPTETAAEEEPEMDPALVEWARKQADEAEAAATGITESVAATKPEPEPEPEEASSFASSEAFRSFLEQVDSESAPQEPETQRQEPVNTAPGSFELSGAGMFDALNAPTRPIVRPKTPPQPPVIKGFEAFKKDLEPVADVPEPAVPPLETPMEVPAPEPAVYEKPVVEEIKAASPDPVSTGLPLPVVSQETASTQSQRIRLSPTINKYLGLDEHSEITFQDVMNQVRRWPGVSGCVIAGKDGLPISAVVDDVSFSKSLSAFAPKIVSRVSELFVDLGMPEVQEIHVPMEDVSTFLFMEGGVYFIVLYKDASMPHWYRKVIKAVLEEIGSKHK